MPRLSEEARRERKDRIAQAAIRAFADKGIAGTSMADIIKEAGLSAGSIYSHFDSKAQLMRFTARAIMETRGAVAVEKLAGNASPPGPQEVMRLVVMEIMPQDLGTVLIAMFAEAATDPELLEVVDEALGGARALLGSLLLPWAELKAGKGRFEGLGAQELAARAANATLVNVHGLLIRRALSPRVDLGPLMQDLLLGWDED